jgi:thioredoxin-dependent peroxiredoxin
MARITLKGNPVNTVGELPETGKAAPDFLLTKTDLSDVTLKDFAGKTVVLNIFPSVDTPVCATSVRKFNAEIDKFGNAVVLCVSRDLPFAMQRFCGAEGLDNVVPASVVRNLDFGEKYGVGIADGPLAGMLARAIVIIDGGGKVTYTQQVPEIAQEPDYDAALAQLK